MSVSGSWQRHFVRALRLGFVALAGLTSAGAALAQQCGTLPGSLPLVAGSGTRLTFGTDALVNGSAVTGTGNAVDTRGRRTTSTTAVPLPSTDRFPTFTASANTSSTTVAEGMYSSVSASGTTRFTGGTYYIGNFNSNATTLELAAGDYFIQNWSLNNGTAINVVSGPVRIFLAGSLNERTDLRFNAGGNPANLQIYLTGSATASFGSNLQFAGVLIGAGSSNSVRVGDNAQITGAMLVGGDLAFGSRLAVTYSERTEAQLAGFTTCRAPIAEYRFEQNSYNGTAGEVLASAGTSNGRTSGGATSTASGRVCRGLSVPANTTISPSAGFDSGVALGSQVGNVGTIMFWYRGNTAWNSGTRKQLVDATSAATGNTGVDPYFYFTIAENGAGVLRLEGNRDNPFVSLTGPYPVAAGTWVHVTITWDMLRGLFSVNLWSASLTAGGSSTQSPNGELIGDLATIFFGDNRTQYLFDS
ncbi:MAG: hypothetical protein MUF30_11315, partial [Burkholderiales bacterium]|nr:hypothetical protein [Burkholderiales bacterium]